MTEHEKEDDFVEVFKKEAIDKGFKLSDEGGARSAIATNTYCKQDGKCLRYTKEGHTLVMEIWPAIDESLVTSIEFTWDGDKWLQPKLNETFSTSDLVTHLLHSAS